MGVSWVINYVTIEFLLMGMSVVSDSMFIGVIYKPLNASFGTFAHVNNFNNIVLKGDININLNATINYTKYLTSMVHSSGLTIVPHNSTHHIDRSSTCMDLMTADDLDKIQTYAQNSIPFLSNHDLITNKYKFSFTQPIS